MKAAVISSGSKANCSYIENDKSAILIDCGLSAKQAKIRLDEIGADQDKISAIFVTHEHGDHIRGISVLSRQLKVPVYANERTSRKLDNIFGLEIFVTGEEFEFLDFNINPFSIVHDATDPVGFSVVSDGVKFSQATDLGRVTNVVKESIKDSNFLLVETNYDQQKLNDCSYPWELKQRIHSIHGHLSNEDGALLLDEVNNPNLKHVILGHLSENSNEPELALKAVNKIVEADHFKTLECGSVYKSTPLMSL